MTEHFANRCSDISADYNVERNRNGVGLACFIFSAATKEAGQNTSMPVQTLPGERNFLGFTESVYNTPIARLTGRQSTEEIILGFFPVCFLLLGPHNNHLSSQNLLFLTSVYRLSNLKRYFFSTTAVPLSTCFPINLKIVPLLKKKC